MLKNKLLLALIISLKLLYAEDILDVDSMLSNIEKKMDLSKKTLLENSGISIVYTRNDIERMQAKYLKDILKSNNLFLSYENRYGLTDPFNLGDSIPFVSSSIRLFIDNQEIVGGMYGSGLILYGDLDIGFIDHIEIYTHTPTYEYSTEPTVVLIKMYSKTADRDNGSKIELNAGSYGATRVSGYTSNELDSRWSYFTYVSIDNLNRETHNYKNSKLSRDKDDIHLFTTFSNKEHKIIVDAIKSKRDGFIGPSIDATPLKNKIYSQNLHLGYDTTLNYFSFLMAFDYLLTESDFKDDTTALVELNGMYPYYMRDIDSTSKIFTTELKYKNNYLNNSYIIGLKYRYKNLKYTKNITNDIVIKKEPTSQSVKTAFIENQYRALNNLILTAGVQYVDVTNKNVAYNKKNDFFLYRFAITYLLREFTFKTVGSHTETYLEPYLIDSSLIVNGDIDNHKSDTIYENIIYKKENNKYELIFGYQESYNYLFPDTTQGGRLNAQDKALYAYSAMARWEYNYNSYDKLFSEFAYIKVDNIAQEDSFGAYNLVIRSLNSYKKFDILNEVIYSRYKGNADNYYDYNFGVRYKYTNDFVLSLKGENIFHKAVESSYVVQNASTLQIEDKLQISPNDRKVTLSMEYLF